MFDPRSPYHRRRWHYDSDQPLSVAQLIAAGSLDAPTAALLWVCVERHRSLIVSGPTDPTPGIGKTTTLNALLEFLPAGTTLVYTMGMYEDFDFLSQTEPPTTCVLANEVSDHLPIYMWGRVARQLLKLPGDGYAVATSCHADTMSDVLGILHDDLKLDQVEAGRLGIVVNIGLVGRIWPPKRRFLTVHYLRPVAANADADAADQPAAPSGGRGGGKRGPRAEAVPLMRWEAANDTFTPPTAEALCVLAGGLGMTQTDLERAIRQRTAVLHALADGRGASIQVTRQAIEELMLAEAGGTSNGAAGSDSSEEPGGAP